MSSAAAAASSTVWAWRPEGTGTPWRANTCLPWYSSRSIRGWTVVGRASRPSRRPRMAWKRRSLSPWHHGRAMAIPKEITFVTFDVYGTLIDWETGAYEAFKREADRDGFTIELYAEVLRRTAVQIAKTLGWPLEPSRAGFLPDSVQRWPPFKETNSVLQKIKKKYYIGLISNIDDKLLGQTRRHIPLDFDLVVTAQQVRSYKPDPAHFIECERRIGGKKGWVHVAASYYHDVEPCLKRKIPVIWVNRSRQQLEAGQKKPDAEVHNLREAAKLIGAA